MKLLFALCIASAQEISPLTPQIISFEKTCSREVNEYLKTLTISGRRTIKSAVQSAVKKSAVIRKETYYTTEERNYRMRPRLEACQTASCKLKAYRLM